MNKFYFKEIRLYFYISCSKISILINDHQPTIQNVYIIPKAFKIFIAVHLHGTCVLWYTALEVTKPASSYIRS
jgi:hypothetical protein